MERKEIIFALINEGFSLETLSVLNDNQLTILSNRILTEQTVNIPKENKQAIDQAKKEKKQFTVYEEGEKSIKKTETQECDIKSGKKIQEPYKTEVKEDNKPFTGKVVERKKVDKAFKTEVKEADKPSEGLTKKEKSSVVKKAIAGKDIGKKGKGFEAVVKSAKKSGADNPEAVAASAMWKNIKRESVELEEDNKPFTGSKPTNKFKGKRLELKQLNEATEKLPDDTAEAVYADATSKDQATAKEIANENAKNKFRGKFPGQESIKFVETATRTDDNEFKYVVGLKVKNNGEEIIDDKKTISEEIGKIVSKKYYPSTTKGDILEIIKTKLNEQVATLAPTKKKVETNLPEFLTYDEIVKSDAGTKTKEKPGTTTKPGEKDRPSTPYQPGPGANPGPKALSKKL